MDQQIKKFCEPEGSDQLRELTLQMQKVKLILEYLREYHPIVFEQAIRRATINKNIIWNYQP